MSEKAIRQFVDLLYPAKSRLPEGARFSLWELPDRRSYHFLVRDPELEIAAASLDGEGRNVFFGVGLRRGDLGPHARGVKADIVALPGFWADVDLRGGNHAAENLPADIIEVVQKILAPFPWEPSAVINSGGGIHAYWLFEDPLWITDQNRAEVEEDSRSFQERLALGARAAGFKWDMTADIPRVLRPVGTHNRKGEPKPVEFMGISGTRYSYALFQKALKTKAGSVKGILGRETSSPVPDAPGPIRTVDTRTEAQVLEDLHNKMRKNRKPDRTEVLAALKEGKPFARPGERDKVLQQVASWIAFYDQNADPEVLVEVLRPSLEAMAGANPQGAMTIDDAVEKISRAQNDARRKSALAEAANEGIRAALQKSARSLWAKPDKPTDLAVVPSPPNETAKPSPAALPLDALLGGSVERGRPQGLAALSVVANPGDPEWTASKKKEIGYYSADELKDFIDRQSKLCGRPITPSAFKKRWVIQYGDACFVFCNGRYLTPIRKSNFRTSAHRDLSCIAEFDEAGHYYFSPVAIRNDGSQRLKIPDEIFDEIATVARHVVADMTLQDSYYDSESQIFYEAVCPLRPDLTPLYDSHIEEWLKLVGGADIDKLLDWIATVTYLQAPSCGLFLSGPPNTGKSLLANGLARLYHTGGYTRMEDVVGSFNGDFARCPIVVADEALPDGPNGKPISTKRLRDIISADTRSLKRKFMDNASLTGTLRCMFLANSERLLDLGDETLGPNSLDAVASRFLHINIAKAASTYLDSLGGRHGGTAGWVNDDQIARHALWLRDTRQVMPAGRFWVQGHVSKMHQLLVTAPILNSLVVEFLVKYLLKPHGEVKATGGIIAGNGELWVNSNCICENWGDYIKNRNQQTPATRNIALALKAFMTGGGKDPISGGRIMLNPRGQRLRYWGVRVDTVLAWAKENGVGDVDELEAIINRKVAMEAL